MAPNHNFEVLEYYQYNMGIYVNCLVHTPGAQGCRPESVQTMSAHVITDMYHGSSCRAPKVVSQISKHDQQ